MAEKQKKPVWDEENVGILAYGSLLTDPGPDIVPHIIDHIPQETPWRVEYARRSDTRGGAATLVPHPKGAQVMGKVLVLDLKRPEEAKVREWLRIREGRTSQKNIKSTNLCGLKTVLYADLPATVHDDEMTGENLADWAISSISVLLDRNGIKYLADNIEQGIQTPLTEAYCSAILAKTGAKNLREAAEIVVGLRTKLAT